MTAKILAKHLAQLGRKGGHARAAKLSPERRREIARKAARARWAGHTKPLARQPASLLGSQP